MSDPSSSPTASYMSDLTQGYAARAQTDDMLLELGRRNSWHPGTSRPDISLPNPPANNGGEGGRSSPNNGGEGGRRSSPRPDSIGSAGMKVAGTLIIMAGKVIKQSTPVEDGASSRP